MRYCDTAKERSRHLGLICVTDIGVILCHSQGRQEATLKRFRASHALIEILLRCLQILVMQKSRRFIATVQKLCDMEKKVGNVNLIHGREMLLPNLITCAVAHRMVQRNNCPFLCGLLIPIFPDFRLA